MTSPVAVGGCLGEIMFSGVDEVAGGAGRGYRGLLSKSMHAKPGATVHLDSDQDSVELAARGARGLELHRAPAGRATVDLFDGPVEPADGPFLWAAVGEELYA